MPSQLQWRLPIVLDAASQPARQSAVTVWLGAAVRPLGDATPRRWPQRPCQTAGTALPEPHTHPQLKPGYKERLPTSRGPHFSTALPTTALPPPSTGPAPSRTEPNIGDRENVLRLKVVRKVIFLKKRNRIPSLNRNDASRREADLAAGLPSLGGCVCAIADAHVALRAPRSSRIVSPARSTAHARHERFRAYGRRDRACTRSCSTPHTSAHRHPVVMQGSWLPAHGGPKEVAECK